MFGAHEAKDKGLVTRVVPDDEVEDEALRHGRSASPTARRWSRAGTRSSRRRLADPRPLRARPRYDEGFACFGTEDFRIGYRRSWPRASREFKGR